MINKLLKNSPVLEAIQGFVPRASRRRQGFKVPRATKIHNLYKIEFDGFRQKPVGFLKSGRLVLPVFNGSFLKPHQVGVLVKRHHSASNLLHSLCLHAVYLSFRPPPRNSPRGNFWVLGLLSSRSHPRRLARLPAILPELSFRPRRGEENCGVHRHRGQES
jgi:hypothetical protein